MSRTVFSPPSDQQLNPLQGNNGSIELGYNANGDLVRIRKTISGTTYTKTITNDDQTVSTTKTFSAWA